MINALFGNWKTTLFGAIGAVAIYLQSRDGAWNAIGSLAVLLLGIAAKDSGAAPPAP